MSVEFKPVSVIKTRLGIQRYGSAHNHFAQRCRLHMNKYVPGGEDGSLAFNSDIDSKCNIIYETPYARYQYHGKLMIDPKYKKGAFYNENYGFWSRKGVRKELTDKDLHCKKAGTGPYWDKKMVSAEMSEIEKELEAYIKRGGK